MIWRSLTERIAGLESHRKMGGLPVIYSTHPSRRRVACCWKLRAQHFQVANKARVVQNGQSRKYGPSFLKYLISRNSDPRHDFQWEIKWSIESFNTACRSMEMSIGDWTFVTNDTCHGRRGELCIADKMTVHYLKNELKLSRRLRLGLRAVILDGELTRRTSRR